MKTSLRILAVILILGALIFWGAKGANRGWTKVLIPIKIHDEITGIDGVTYEKKFVPGVDFLAKAVGAGIALAGVSFLFRTKRRPQSSNLQQN